MDFESITSAIPSHRQEQRFLLYNILEKKSICTYNKNKIKRNVCRITGKRSVLFYIIVSDLCAQQSNALPWADSNAIAAAHTFHRIHNGVEIHNMNSVMLTGFFTLHAADTADFADFVGHRTLVTVAAPNDGLLFSGNECNQMLRAGFYAHGTALAARRVNSCHAVAYADRSILARPHAVAQPHTAVLAARDTAGHQRGTRARFDSFVFHFVTCIIVAAEAMHQGYFFFDLSCITAEVIRNRFGNGITAHRTETGLRFAAGHRFRVAFAARESAGAAVRAGEHIAYCLCLFIFRHSHDNGGNGENQAGKKTDTGYNQNRSKYVIHILHS
jgi:hypothetical protein